MNTAAAPGRHASDFHPDHARSEERRSATWRAELAAYDDRIAALNDPKLRDLDVWYQRDLARAARTRSPPHLLKDEYVKLVEEDHAREWRDFQPR